MLFGKKRVSGAAVPGTQVVSGIQRINAGAFGSGSPATAFETQSASPAPAAHHYYEGLLFDPGAENFVFVPGFELPLVTVWGNAFLRTPNVFNPVQPPQVYAPQNVLTNGLGGLVAGDVQLTGLINPEGDTSGFAGDFAY